jgi:hypothetical protein
MGDSLSDHLHLAKGVVTMGDGAADGVLVRVRFMSYAGLIVSAVFLYAIVINGLGIALSGLPCG